MDVYVSNLNRHPFLFLSCLRMKAFQENRGGEGIIKLMEMKDG